MRSIVRTLRELITRVKASLSWKKLVVLAGAAVAIAWSIFLQEATKQLFSRWFSDPPSLTYQIVSVDRVIRPQLSEYAAREFGNVFNLQLDDDVLLDYEIFKVRIRNDGGAIDHKFKLDAVVNDGFAKIIDLKHVIRAPTNKRIPIAYALPDLWWNTTPRQKVHLSWKDPTNTEIIGSLLYRSSYKDFGYGKFILGMIKSNCVVLNTKDVFPGYYAIIAVGRTGGLSDMSNPLWIPESLAFGPSFKNVVWINPTYKPVKDCPINDTPVYTSLKEAIDREGPSQTFIIKAPRSEGHALILPPNIAGHRPKILYEDELKFLKGSIEFVFTEGLDSRSEVDFYFLTKALPGVKRNLRLLLHGPPKLTFTTTGENLKEPMQKQAPNIDAKKALLTPKRIVSYATKSSIVFDLSLDKNQAYKGVRVFRKIVDPRQSTVELGEELYDGKLDHGYISCAHTEAVSSPADLELPIYAPPAPSEPPTRAKIPKPGIRLPPAAPTSLGIKPDGNEKAPSYKAPSYFEDSAAQDNVKYKYTIYLFDANDKYSYPTEIYASRADDLPGLDCRITQVPDKQNGKPKR